jgi:hypothetical protein
MTRRGLTTGLAAPAMAAGALPATAVAGVGDPTDYDRRIVSVDRQNRSFRLRDLEHGVVRIRVVRATRYERIAGFSSLRRGPSWRWKSARGPCAAWVAVEVERRGPGFDD